MRRGTKVGPKTKPYRNQHLELARLAAAIPTDSYKLDAREASHALACLKSVLIVHLKLQDGMLYPWMMHQSSFELREKARHFRDMMHGLLVKFLEFHQRWTHAGAIAADPSAFVSAWLVVLGVLKHRLGAEASDLYPAIDLYAMQTPAPMAS